MPAFHLYDMCINLTLDQRCIFINSWNAHFCLEKYFFLTCHAKLLWPGVAQLCTYSSSSLFHSPLRPQLHQTKLFISPFPTPLDHFHFHPTSGPAFDLILSMCFNQVIVVNTPLPPRSPGSSCALEVGHWCSCSTYHIGARPLHIWWWKRKRVGQHIFNIKWFLIFNTFIQKQKYLEGSCIHMILWKNTHPCFRVSLSKILEHKYVWQSNQHEKLTLWLSYI